MIQSMEFKNISVNLKNSNLLRLPLNQNLRQITLDPNKFQTSDVTLICYKIHLIQENEEVYAYLFKNINPTSIFYNMKIRDGDRLITLNNQDVTRISCETFIIENKIPFTCRVVWQPELYIEFGTFNIKNIDQEQDSQRLISNNMYEYLTKILRNLFDYHPKESHRLCEELFRKQGLSTNNQTDSYLFAQKQLTIHSNHSTIEGNPEEIMKNIFELNNLFEQIGIGLNKDEIYWIWLSMKNLFNEKTNIQKLRFWGKIFGIKNNYYIIEVDSDQESFSIEEENEINNQKIFYVSTGIDKSFIQLPMVTHEQIEVSRRIQQFFTGDLEASVRFELGVEKYLLCAQIQRISAGTQIGPKNYFKISNSEEETIEKFDLNNEFQGNTLENLSLSNGQYWVHCIPYLNHQEKEKIFVESLSTINKDTTINGLYPAWSIGIASTLVPEYTSVYVRSNRWPGAFTVGDRHRFNNIYIGWGMKNLVESHQANLIDILPSNEYEFELIEIDDPTIEEENELFKSSILLSPDEDEEFENNL